MRRQFLLILFVVLLIGGNFAIPMQLPVQGKLKGQTAGDVNKQLPMTFSIYSVASGGSAIWSQTKNVDVNIIDVDNNIGVFSTLIGDVDLLDFNSHSDMNFLGIKIQSNAELSPRIRIGTTAYAQVARRLAIVEDLNVESFGVKAFGDSNFNRVYANFLFGNGSGLTGVLASTNWADINAHVYGKLDVNAHFYGKVDLNNNFWGKLDINNQFVPYVSAIRDLNLNFHDLNARSVSAVAFFGSGAELTGVMSQADVNNHYVGFVRTGNTVDVNLALGGLTAWDANFYTLEADKLFGDASGVTGVLTLTDGNAHYVPYLGADFDVNLGVYGLKAFGDSNFATVGIIGRTFFNSDVNATGSIQAARFFGDGSGLTNLPSGLTWADINAHVYGKLDTNTMFEDVFDLNLFYPTKADLNANFYGKLDINNQFVPYISATKNVNLGNYNLAAKDLNATSGVKALGLFSTTAQIGNMRIASGSITDSSDVIDFGNAVLTTGGDILVTVGVISTTALSASSDSNLTNVEGDYFFGNGSGLTNVSASTNWADINAHIYGKLDTNAHFVPFIGAAKDVNLNRYDLNAFTILGNRFRMPTTTATGAGSVAFGSATGSIISSGIGSIAMGRAFGAGVPLWATDEGSIAMGYAVGAEGIKSTAFGSIAMGYGGTSGVKSGGLGSISLGFDTKAFGIGAISIGSDTNANCTTGCVAIGYQTINTTDNSVALGLDVNVARTLKVMQDVNISKGVNKGVSISGDVNRICFPSNSCEMYIDFNGTAFIFGS